MTIPAKKPPRTADAAIMAALVYTKLETTIWRRKKIEEKWVMMTELKQEGSYRNASLGCVADHGLRCFSWEGIDRFVV